jgi:hypothetical protein
MAYTAITPYADKSYGDAYFAERLNTTAWTSATDDNKTAALKQATRMIDLLPLVDEKCDDTQAREFPRSVDAGCADDSGDVPAAVQDATCELAIAFLENKTLEQLSSNEGIKSKRVGDASQSYADGRGRMALADDNLGLPSPTAARLLAPWISDAAVDLSRV